MIIEVCAIIGAVAAVVAALISFFNYFKITRVYHATNSMKDELVAQARKTADATGYERGRIEGRDYERMREEDREHPRRK